MLLSSIKGVNRLKSKGMSNIFTRKTMYGFSFNFERNYDIFKVKESMHFVDQNYKI